MCEAVIASKDTMDRLERPEEPCADSEFHSVISLNHGVSAVAATVAASHRLSRTSNR